MKRKLTLSVIIVTLLVGGGLLRAQNSGDVSMEEHDLSLHCQHFPADCEDETQTNGITNTLEDDHTHSADIEGYPLEPGQGMFGAISEINKLIEENGVSWANIDMDVLWDHLRDMDALMSGVTVNKTKLENGLLMEVSGTGAAKTAMDNMLPAHSAFLTSVREDWDIELSEDGSNYQLVVTSKIPSEAQRIQALGFSGFMVQDDHHASHHLGLALGDQVH